MVTKGGSVEADLTGGLADVEAGAQWHYSSPGFLLSGLIVERASGQPYRDGQPVPPWDLDAMPGTGDIWSATGDLTRFLNNRLASIS
jgi:hypothetical protein